MGQADNFWMTSAENQTGTARAGVVSPNAVSTKRLHELQEMLSGNLKKLHVVFKDPGCPMWPLASRPRVSE